MKLVLSINKRTGSEPINDAKVAFAHIADKVWLKDFKILTSRQDTDIVSIEWEKQPGSTAANHIELIKDAVSLRGYISLLEVDKPLKSIDVPGLKYIGTTDEGELYKVLFDFASYLAREKEARLKCADQKTIEMKFNFEETVDGSYIYTGGVSITSAPNAPLMRNAYNAFARVLQNDNLFRQKILSKEVNNIKFTLKASGSSLTCSQVLNSQEESKTASRTTKNPRNMNDFELLLHFTQINNGWIKKSDSKFIFISTDEVSVDKMFIYLEAMGITKVKKLYDSNKGLDVLIAGKIDDKYGDKLYL